MDKLTDCEADTCPYDYDPEDTFWYSCVVGDNYNDFVEAIEIMALPPTHPLRPTKEMPQLTAIRLAMGKRPYRKRTRELKGSVGFNEVLFLMLLILLSLFN